MNGKEGFLILLNLAILGIVIAAAVYIFQIGNGNRSVKCTALDKFGDDSATCKVITMTGNFSECDEVIYKPNESLQITGNSTGCEGADLKLSQLNTCTNLSIQGDTVRLS